MKRCLLLPFASLPTTLLPLLLQPSLSSDSFRPLTSGSPLLYRPRPPLPSSLSLTLPPSVVSTLSPPCIILSPLFPPTSHPFISLVLPAPPPSIHPVYSPSSTENRCFNKVFFSSIKWGGKLILSVGAVAELDTHTIHTHTHTHRHGGLCCVLLLISKNKSRGQRQEAEPDVIIVR